MKRWPPLYYHKPFIITTANFKELEEYKFSDFKMMPARGLCGILQLMFTYGIAYAIQDDGTYIGRYCYNTYREALEALSQWNGVGDPPGMWAKHKGSVMEYINPARFRQHIEYREWPLEKYYDLDLSEIKIVKEHEQL